ncbi:MAG: MerR family transcriptional regulator [Lachnospiraceae bacterium]|nr:MerR family transcriptional regulator [Lachnospiraceae bacterium]
MSEGYSPKEDDFTIGECCPEENTFAGKIPRSHENAGPGIRIGELSRLTGVKAGTIRFYERCGFLEPARRLPNGYRAFHARHIYQIRVCRLVFGGFVNKRLRKISMGIIRAARDWDFDAYRKETGRYLQAVEEDIAGTKKAIDAVLKRLHGGENAGMAKAAEMSACAANQQLLQCADAPECVCSKKQAAALVGVTPEAIRNWERNGLLGQTEPYRKRFYSQWALDRMYVIRLLLDNGYSMMAVRSFFAEFDTGDGDRAAGLLMAPGESEALIYRADRYMETLLHAREKAGKLCRLLEEMQSLGETPSV